jgi:hypothetical protein
MSEAFLSTQEFGNLNYDTAEDLEYPPAPAEASSNVSSHLYTSAVKSYEEFDFNNLNQPLPVSDENIFEFVDFNDLLPTGDYQIDRSTRPEAPTEMTNLITPVDRV